MDKGRRRPGEMQKLLNNGRHGEAKPNSKVLSGKKHGVVFSTQSRLIRLLHQFEVDVSRDIAVGPQFLHRKGGDDAACRRHPTGRSSLTTHLTGGSRFLTSRHSASRPKGGERKQKSAPSRIPNW